MTPTKEFLQVNQIFGWGDPGDPERQGIWFIGIEEAGSWPEITGSVRQLNQLAEDEIKQLIEEATKQIEKKHLDLQELHFDTVNQSLTEAQKKSRVIRYSAKIACTLSPPNQRANWTDVWIKYCNDVLYRNGSSVCNINLFPCGKADTNYWPPHYTELFGLNKKMYKKYIDQGCGGRFEEMRKYWERSRPLATICYWGMKWEKYAQFFGLKIDKKEFPPTKRDREILCNDDIRIIITPHFSRGMSHKRVEVIREQLENWKVQLPK